MTSGLLTVDTKQLKAWESKLRRLNARGVAYAEAQTMNDLAFAGQRDWKSTLPQRMTLRSGFVLSQIQVEKARPNKALIEASLGASQKADFMFTQELGGTEGKRGKHGIPIPAKPTGKRPMPKAKQFQNIKLMQVKGGGSRGQAVHAAIAQAKKKGGPVYAYLRLRGGGKRQGIYQIDPSRKRRQVSKVWSLHRSNVVIPARPTMRGARDRAMRLRDVFWYRAMDYQLRRLGAK